MSSLLAFADDLRLIEPILVLWVGAAVILLWEAFGRGHASRAVSPALAAAAAGFALVLVCGAGSGIGASYAFARGVASDPIALIGSLAVLAALLLSVFVAWTDLANRGLARGEFHALALLAASGAMLMAAANDLIVLFLGLEVLSFGLYILAGYARTDARSDEASLKYFLLGAFASAFLLYGIALVYGATQTTNLADVAAAIKAHALSSPMLLGGIALKLVGLGFKAALVPFHQWTPDAYEGAPTSAAAFMATTAKVGAFTAILRVFDAFVGAHASWLPAVQALAILSMVFGNLLAVTQTNVKRMLAYSSIAHAGYLMVTIAALGIGRATPAGLIASDLALRGAAFYLLAYVFMTIGAFGVLVYLGGKGRDVQTLSDLKGLVNAEPLAAYSMLFFVLSLAGVPPTMGFMGKLQILYAALAAGQTPLAIVLALTSVMGAYYYLRIVWVMCFEGPRKAEELPSPASRTPATVTLVVAGVATIVFGIFPGLLGAFTFVGW